MLTFLKILLFGTSILITPESVNISSTPLDIPLNDKVEAINSGANLSIDISDYIKSKNIIDRLNEAKSFIDINCLSAKLLTGTNESIALDSIYQSVTNDGTYIGLTNKNGIPTGIKFTHLIISSCKPINGTKITWQNFHN